MRLISILLPAGVMLVPAMALAQTANESATPAQQGAVSATAAQQEKKICKTERVTGSLTRRTRICLTQREWTRMAEGSQRNLDGLLDDANQKFAVERFPEAHKYPGGPF